MRELIFYVAKQFSIVFHTFWPLPLVTRGRYVDTHTREREAIDGQTESRSRRESDFTWSWRATARGHETRERLAGSEGLREERLALVCD